MWEGEGRRLTNSGSGHTVSVLKVPNAVSLPTMATLLGNGGASRRSDVPRLLPPPPPLPDEEEGSFEDREEDMSWNSRVAVLLSRRLIVQARSSITGRTWTTGASRFNTPSTNAPLLSPSG